MPDSDKNAPAQTKENLQFPFSEEDWANTPASVQEFLIYLISSHAALEKRIEELEKRLNKNSSNSNKPPSSDNAFEENRRKRVSPRRKNDGRAFGRRCLSPLK